MAVLGLQGVRGGVGTTTITAALAWSLQMLGENVTVVDACPDNLLRLSFNVDFTHRQGWARAMLDGQTDVTLGCATPRSSICCLLVSYPLKNKKIHSTGKPG